MVKNLILLIKLIFFKGSTIEEKSELSETMTKSEISNQNITLKKSDSSCKHKSLIGKFQNLFKSSHNNKKAEKNKNLTKFNLPNKFNLKENPKSVNCKVSSKNNVKKENVKDNVSFFNIINML